MPKNKNSSTIYLSDAVRERLRVPQRSQSRAVSATIDRYYTLIDPERKRLESIFSENEWIVIRTLCWYFPWNGHNIRGGVLAIIQDSSDYIISHYGVERKTLESKLSKLNLVQQYALVEMIESYWELNK
jgi:hypothetical protein